MQSEPIFKKGELTGVMVDLRKRVVRDFMDILILNEMQKDPMTGYEVISYLQKKFNVSLSSGTVYGTLYAMERLKVIEGFVDDGKRLYKVSEKGKKEAVFLLKVYKLLQDLLIESERALKESEANQIGEPDVLKNHLQKFANAWVRTFDLISDMVFILDMDFKIVKANKATGKMLGKKPSELVGKHCFEVMHCDKEPFSNCPCKKIVLSKREVTEEINDPHIGIPLSVTVSPIFDDKDDLCGVVHIAKDISR